MVSRGESAVFAEAQREAPGHVDEGNAPDAPHLNRVHAGPCGDADALALGGASQGHEHLVDRFQTGSRDAPPHELGEHVRPLWVIGGKYQLKVGQVVVCDGLVPVQGIGVGNPGEEAVGIDGHLGKVGMIDGAGQQPVVVFSADHFLDAEVIGHEVDALQVHRRRCRSGPTCSSAWCTCAWSAFFCPRRSTAARQRNCLSRFTRSFLASMWHSEFAGP